jgi:hypothetical protein
MKQKSLRDVSLALQKATEALEEIQQRAETTDLSFEQKVIAAARGMENGDPLKDYLSREEVEDAVKMLADVFTVTGVKMPADW